MHQPYPIITLPPDARDRDEQMGTKEKFWTRDENKIRWLFKFNRPGHGDDWSEKIASEIAGKLELPHAHVELATFEGKPGVVSRDFTVRGKLPLIHGNELLQRIIDPRYPTNQNRNVTEHTIESVRRILDEVWIAWRAGDPKYNALAEYYPDIAGVDNARDLFSGYLLLDALIGNTDRHHENWAIVGAASYVFSTQNSVTHPDARVFQYFLAPTYDHASCLGFNLTNEARLDMLTPGRNRSVETFANKATSKLYLEGTTKPLSTVAAFAEMTKDRPLARQAWIPRLEKIPDIDFRAIIDRVPAERMSQPARDFAFALLKVNRDRILNSVK